MLHVPACITQHFEVLDPLLFCVIPFSVVHRDQINMTATLVLRDVSEEDLLKNYTCKLESDQHTSFATISLAEKGIVVKHEEVKIYLKDSNLHNNFVHTFLAARPVPCFLNVFVIICILVIVTVVLIILLSLAYHLRKSKFSIC